MSLLRALPAPRRVLARSARAAVFALVAAGALAGCHRDKSKKAHRARGAGARALRKPAEPWVMPTLTAVRGVPIDSVRAAIAARLAGARPAPLDADQWAHARTLYRRYGGAPLWMNADGADPQRATALLRAVVDADRDALRLDAYPLTELARATEAIRAPRPTAAQLAEADVLLTSAFAAFGEDLMTGQVNPRTVSQDWHIDPKEEDVDSALALSLGERQVDQGLARMRPEDPDYEALRTALVAYRALDAKGGWATVPAGRALKPGEPEKATRLAALRSRLGAEGLLAAGAQVRPENTVPAANATGGDSAGRARRAQPRAPRAPGPGEAVYDATLAGAVAAYQARHAIVVDSVLGDETVKSMNLPASYRLAQIAANLERHRWMPRALGDRAIIVNVPAFHLEAWDGGERALEMKVIVGQEYEDKKTAVFSDTMTTVVFRPYWNITDDIAASETWPKIDADPNYMKANDLETYQEAGKTRLRQKPGDKNSLGLVKFLFPNAFNIYLHDTPQRELFAKDVRAFSHGCIRLEHPDQLAEWVLDLDADSVRSAMTTPPDNKAVKVPRPVPVYITYFTTYARDGQLHFGNDLYGRDAALVKVMTAGSGQRPETVRAVQAIRRAVAS